MGRKLTASEETQLLKDATRDAHAAMKGLYAAIREANLIAPKLVADFEAVHRREIEELSNYFCQESNRHAADLNADISRARAMINEQIMAGQAVFDAATRTVTISWSATRFDDQQPLPYPNQATRETPQ